MAAKNKLANIWVENAPKIQDPKPRASENTADKDADIQLQHITSHEWLAQIQGIRAQQGSSSEQKEGSEKIAFRAEHVDAMSETNTCRQHPYSGEWRHMDLGFQDALQDKWAEVLDVHLVHMLCALGVRGAAECPLSLHRPWAQENLRLSVCQKKTQAWGQGEVGLVQAMKRGFRGMFYSICRH